MIQRINCTSKLKTSIEIDTKITGELTHQDLIDITRTYGLAPPDLDSYSVEVIGGGISGGAKLILRNTFTGKTAPTVTRA